MRRALCSLAMAAIAACSNDPLRPPEVPVVERYTATAVAEDRLAPGKDIPAQWWTLFRSPPLDALVFVDATCHGSAKRVNPGERRICVYRYGPSWGNFRWGYTPSDALLARLSPLARKIVRPQQGLRPPSDS